MPVSESTAHRVAQEGASAMPRSDLAAGRQGESLRRRTSLRRLLAVLEREALHQSYAHARAAYPDECCGFILASGVRRCENVQDALHRDDPVTFPRSARRGFTLSAEDQLFLMQALRGPDPVLAIYHSHIDAGAYFSAADRAGITYDGYVAYPDLFYLVIACQSELITGSKLFHYDGRDFRAAASFAGAEM